MNAPLGRLLAVAVTAAPCEREPMDGFKLGIGQGVCAASLLASICIVPSCMPPSGTPPSVSGVLPLPPPHPTIAIPHASVAVSDRDAKAAKPFLRIPPNLGVIFRTPSWLIR